MLRVLKAGCLAAAKSLGLFSIVSKSHYRTSRVLFLGYHGVSLQDEHLWSPASFISPEFFRRRLSLLAQNGCTVLSLDEALFRLANHSLPPKSVVLTFDDGTCDFYRVAWPILKEFGYPATLYLTTYYVENQYPITPYIWSYLLWKANGKYVGHQTLGGKEILIDLTQPTGRTKVVRQLLALNPDERIDAEFRHSITCDLARILDIDLAPLLESRLCQLLNPAEIAELASDGVSVQMHMHIHRSPAVRQAYWNNLQTNRKMIALMTGSTPDHFCYPNGSLKSTWVSWARAFGVKSATTCDPGLQCSSDDPLLIPRLLDSSALSEVDFQSWINGFTPFLKDTFKGGSVHQENATEVEPPAAQPQEDYALSGR